MIGNIGRVNTGDIAMRHFTVVAQIGFLREFIPLGGEDAMAALLLERQADAADTGEKIDKCEVGFTGRRLTIGRVFEVGEHLRFHFQNRLPLCRRRRVLFLFPTANGALAVGA